MNIREHTNKCFGCLNNYYMAFQSLFDFFVLLCYTIIISLLLSASEGCPPSHCGHLGEISFPFTTTRDLSPDCGFYIDGCGEEDAPKKILHPNKNIYFEIDRIKNNSIIIQKNTYDKLSHDPPSELNDQPFHIRNKHDFCFGDDGNLYPSLPCEHEHGQQHLPACTSSISFFEIDVQLYGCEGCNLERGRPCYLNTTNFSCYPVPPPTPAASKSNTVKIGLSTGLALAGVITIVALSLLYNRRNKSLGLENKERNTSGPFRSTTNPESGAVYFGIPVFSYAELQTATNNFDQARELGEGAFGAVYYGKLRDGREVAVKRLFERNYKPVESFSNEIQILTRLRHTNLVSLYGCTSRHSRELLLVYEYVPNGTLSHHLHDDQAKHGLMSWPVRMKIAIETASALNYLHASDIIHRDVKTSNILLDNNFSVKVADFGLSRLYPNDVTHVSTAPRGTPGYVDPDYRMCYQLTSKSDVYSFGVVLAELISSLPAVDLTRSRDDIKLANLAIRKIQRRAFCELVDPSLGFHSDENLKRMIISVAELAFKCLQGDKDLRPSMGEVLEVLQRIESGRYGQGHLEGIDDHGVRVSISYGIPPLPHTPMKPQRLHQTQ